MRGYILIADDDPIMGNLLETRLYESGFDTDFVVSSADAFKTVSKRKPDLIISDSTLSDASASEFYDRLQKTPETRGIASIFLCSEKESDEFKRRLRMDGNEYLNKPFIMADLINLTETIMEQMLPSESEPTAISHMKCIDAFRQAEQNRFTGAAELYQCSVKAGVFFQFGSIAHAYHGSTTGKKALFRIIADSCIVESFQDQSVTVKTINDPLDVLIQEGSQEAEALKKLKPETFESYIILHSIPKLNEIKKDSTLAHTISLIGECAKVKDIIDQHPLPDLQVYKQLIYLIKIGAASVKPFMEKIPVQIITDSTSDLPRELVESSNIIVIPQTVSINQNSYKDGKDIFPEEYYQLLKKSKHYPATFPPSEKEIHDTFLSVISEKDILAILTSKKLSKTVDTALSAKQHHADEYVQARRQNSPNSQPNVEILDSQTASLGLGLLALEAAEKSSIGWDFQTVMRYIENLIPYIRVFFMVESLEYLERSGRFGKLKAIFGRLIQERPILGFHRGEVIVIDRLIGQKKALERMADLISENVINLSTPFSVGVMHADNEKWAAAASELMESRLNCKKMILSQIGASSASHCGLGTVGIACLPVYENPNNMKSPWR